ncbi:MAG: glucose-1-phosphate thymidylyltransferase [Thermoplasmata archaeon]
MKGLVLAGGHGTRLRPLTFTGNKHMIPIANQPILFYGLRHLARAGIRDVAIILGPIQEGIRESIGDGREFGLNIEYIVQGAPRGLADAVICAKQFLGAEPFLMYLGDNLLQSGVEQFVTRYEAERPDAVVGATPVAHPEAYGVIELDDGRIVSLVEKPARPKSQLALIGVYLFTESIHPVVEKLRPSRRGELEITEAIWNLWLARQRVSVIKVGGWWKDTGHPGDLLEANELVLGSMPPESFRNEGLVQPGATVEGPVGIGAGSVIESGALVRGPSILGTGVRVGSGSEVGPNCALGNSVSLDRSRVKGSIVLEGAHIEGVHITGSLIGRNVEIRSRHPATRDIVLTIGDSSQVTL